MAMDDNKEAYALALVLQRLLRILEEKGFLEKAESFSLLDDVLEEMREGALGANAHKLVGMLYLPLDETVGENLSPAPGRQQPRKLW